MSMKMVDAYSGFSIDFSRMNFDWAALDALHEKFSRATREMIALESGAIKNPDENRKVTHFTDRVNYRTSGLFNEVEEFAAAVRNGDIILIPVNTFHWIDNTQCDKPFKLWTLWDRQEMNGMYFKRKQEWGTSFRYLKDEE